MDLIKVTLALAALIMVAKYQNLIPVKPMGILKCWATKVSHAIYCVFMANNIIPILHHLLVHVFAANKWTIAEFNYIGVTKMRITNKPSHTASISINNGR
jgi:hypothetical protein